MVPTAALPGQPGGFIEAGRRVADSALLPGEGDVAEESEHDLRAQLFFNIETSLLQFAIVAENVVDPTHHPCLAALPGIFLKAMKGVSAMVDAHLGE